MTGFERPQRRQSDSRRKWHDRLVEQAQEVKALIGWNDKFGWAAPEFEASVRAYAVKLQTDIDLLFTELSKHGSTARHKE